MKKKSILFILSSALIILLALSFLWLLPIIKKKLVLISQGNEIITTSLSLSDVDEEFIEDYNPKTQRKFDVLHYDIKIALYPEDEIIKGDVTITIKVNDKFQTSVDLNFYDNMKINNLTLDKKKINYTRNETHLIAKADAILNDTIRLRIAYEGKPKSLGFGSFNFDKSYSQPLIYSLSEPVFASTWFPCIDLPDDKSYADIFITNDSSYVSLSNGKLISTAANKDKKTYHWKTLYPISTYLISVYSANYKTYSDMYITVNNDTLALYCYATPEKFEDAVKDFTDHKSYLKIFEELFGPYAFPKEKYSIAEFGWDFGAMEHQTITGLGTKYITGKKFFQDMIIHELAHQWWGNAVGLKTWKDIWLNEGFSTYSEALYWERKSGYDALKSTMLPKFGEFKTGTIYNPEINLFIKMVYDKGAWILHMLRKEVGDKMFFEILQSYYKKFAYGNASTDDFKNICEKISGKKLSHFFDQWVYKGIGIIELDINWQNFYESEKNYIKIQLKQLQNGYDIYKFPIDIKIIYENNTEAELKSFYVKKKEETFLIETKYKVKNIEIDPDKWLLVNYEIQNVSKS